MWNRIRFSLNWIARLTAAHNNNNPEDYYTILGERDPIYGTLALGVVLDNLLPS